jgi:dihydroorotate dehydrogenase (fumarate)
MSQQRCPDPDEYERAQYMRALQTFHPPEDGSAPDIL